MSTRTNRPLRVSVWGLEDMEEQGQGRMDHHRLCPGAEGAGGGFEEGRRRSSVVCHLLILLVVGKGNGSACGGMDRCWVRMSDQDDISPFTVGGREE